MNNLIVDQTGGGTNMLNIPANNLSAANEYIGVNGKGAIDQGGGNNTISRGLSSTMATCARLTMKSSRAAVPQTPGGAEQPASLLGPPNTTALGVELNNNGAGGTLMTSFDGQTVTATDVLVKYTFVGDADLSGTINATDYMLIDNGFNTQGSVSFATTSAGPAEMIATDKRRSSQRPPPPFPSPQA